MSGDLLPWDLLAGERRLFLDHLAGRGEARALLGGRGFDDAAVAAAAEERRRAGLPHRADLARAAAEYARTLGVPDAGIAAERLADPRAVVVVGAHQPTVAGGPLLSFAKAIGAKIELAMASVAMKSTEAMKIWVASIILSRVADMHSSLSDRAKDLLELNGMCNGKGAHMPPRGRGSAGRCKAAHPASKLHQGVALARPDARREKS